MGEFVDLDLTDDGADGAILIEWGDAIADSLPPDRLKIHFEGDDQQRSIRFCSLGQWTTRDLGVLS